MIEIQYDRELNYLQRVLYGSSKVITEHIKETESYSKIVKVISISILYFDFGSGDDYIYKGTTSFVGLHNYRILKLSSYQTQIYKTEEVEKIYPEYYLIKVKNFNDVAKDSLDQWIYFLKNEEIASDFKAKEVLDYLKCSEQEKRAYEHYKESLHQQAVFKAECAGISLPVTESVAARCLSLPICSRLADETVKEIAAVIRGVFNA